MRFSSVVKPDRRHVVIATCLLVLAMLLGGGGSPSPGTELALEWLAAFALFAWMWLPGKLRFPVDRRFWILAILVLIVPLLQLLPLPPSLWQALPGREGQVSALGLVGAADSWQPISTSPARTLASLLALAPPLVLMAITSALTSKERQVLIAVIAVMALLAALLGAAQLAAGPSAIRLYDRSHELVVTGFQANRNAAADVFLFGIVALAAWGARLSSGRGGHRDAIGVGWWLTAAGLVLISACVLTASRAGSLFLLPALLGAATVYSLGRNSSWKRLLPAFAGGLTALVAAAAILLRYNRAVQTVAARFGLGDEVRTELWSNTFYAVRQYWPVGSGMGTFVPAFVALEPLEAVDDSVPNRAHNDYLELALEGGLFGLAALAVAIALLAWIAVGEWRARPEDRPQILFALTTLLLVAAHSLVDYPLRSMALACLCATMAGLLTRPAPVASV